MLVAHRKQPPHQPNAHNKLPPPPPPPLQTNQSTTIIEARPSPQPLLPHQTHALSSFLHSPVTQVLASASESLAAGPIDKRSFRYSSSTDGGDDSAIGGAAAIRPTTISADQLEPHMAERLVEAAAHQQRSAFQFDTLTPVRTVWYTPPSAPVGANERNQAAAQTRRQNHSPTEMDMVYDRDTTENENEDDDDDDEMALEEQEVDRSTTSSMAALPTTASEASSDNGGFVTQSSRSSDEDDERRLKRAKRTTVVGNPMFEAVAASVTATGCGASGDDDRATTAAAAAAVSAGLGADSDGGVSSGDDVPAQSLGLDDLDMGMDYEQIMHYFDNLKVSGMLC